MNAKRIAKWFGIGLVASATLVWAGGFLASEYRTVTVPLSESVAVEFTNGSERVALGSVFARADAASNLWTIALVNNNYTNILTTGQLTAANHTIKFESTGGIPIGKSGRVRITGTVNTNGALTTNLVQVSLHTLRAD